MSSLEQQNEFWNKFKLKEIDQSVKFIVSGYLRNHENICKSLKVTPPLVISVICASYGYVNRHF